ncbi:hypothetical protein IMG5_189200 [Ichthyophthirius multifiliis]|uniref:Uncharacterized protein n=1 Tax=Ichthyophthirius multifiliis TaxID=5932 RepID=G0R426_ICHMU|nr:hypothetical protein IMG5_189200 [Ichthyophthirius multifiliis]EGR27778.1 hypothetical protein IMG5_189200 [Ichthyophthirius multifiliis]|eukprot:XP_004026845.1 hypothetical protein IMG5_189200 [Ichthyophthirius multifiliis]
MISESQGIHQSLNRKTTKIEFLSQENQQLREQVQELQNIIKLNKEALRIVMQPSDNISKQQQGNPDHNNYKALNLVLHSLYEENAQLIQINEKISQERNIAQSRALINEQISEASQKHERELIQDLEQKVSNLTKKLKEQEKVIYQYEKTIPSYDEMSGIVIKYRDIINLNDQTFRMHDENEKLNILIQKQIKEINELRNSKQELAKINMVQQKNQQKTKKTYKKKQMSNEILLFFFFFFYNFCCQQKKVHKKLMNQNSEEEDDFEDEMPNLPEKVQTINTDAGKLGLNIPKLDLAKALKIQEINAKKSTMQQLQLQQGSDIGAIMEQYRKNDAELIIAKKNLQREMLLNKTLQIENDNLKRLNIELEARNEIFVYSHNMYEEKWQKIYTAFQHYREFYRKYHQNIAISSKSNTNNNKSIIEILNTSSNNIKYANYYMENNNMSQVNGDYMKKELNSKNLIEMNNIDELVQIDSGNQRENIQNYLLNLAKDVYLIFDKVNITNYMYYQFNIFQYISKPLIKQKINLNIVQNDLQVILQII